MANQSGGSDSFWFWMLLLTGCYVIFSVVDGLIDGIAKGDIMEIVISIIGFGLVAFIYFISINNKNKDK